MSFSVRSRMRLLFLFLFIVSYTVSYSQREDDTIQYIFGLPVTGDEDTSAPQPDVNPEDRLMRVLPEQLPGGLKEALESDELYTGWKNSRILFDVNTRLYWVHLPRGEVIRSYAFSRSGEVVSVRERDAN